MALPQIEKELAERIGTMLAESPLDDEVKKVILDNLDKMPMPLVYRLVDCLEIEKESLAIVASEMERFVKEQKENWDDIVKRQTQKADEIMDKWAKKIVDEEKINSLKNSVGQ